MKVDHKTHNINHKWCFHQGVRGQWLGTPVLNNSAQNYFIGPFNWRCVDKLQFEYKYNLFNKQEHQRKSCL